MDKTSIEAFFDRAASSWDEEMIKDDLIIETILDNARVEKGNTVLDVACGTGVMIPYYLKREALPTGIDLSKKMIEIASNKFKDIEFIWGDVEELNDRKFDRIIVYNAFPHFIDPEALIKHLVTLLKVNGTLTIAHGMSRERINHHHEGVASSISKGLMEASELAKIMSKYLDVYVSIDDDKMYQVSGKLKQDYDCVVLF